MELVRLVGYGRVEVCWGARDGRFCGVLKGICNRYGRVKEKRGVFVVMRTFGLIARDGRFCEY